MPATRLNTFLGNNSVRANQIEPSSIDASKIANGSIIENKIANSAITTDKINNNAITTIKVSDGAITSDKLATLTPNPAGTYGNAQNIPIITTNSKGQVTSVTSAPIGIDNSVVARAWFLSYGNTILSNYNVSSIVSAGTGGAGPALYYFTITFTNPMPNTNYIFIGNVGRSSGRLGAVGSVAIAYTDNGQPPYTNYPSLKTTTQLTISTDLSAPFIHGVIFG